LGLANAFHREHGAEQTAHVKHFTHFILGACALVFGVQLFQHLLISGKNDTQEVTSFTTSIALK
jgi:hypothetical protein